MAECAIIGISKDLNNIEKEYIHIIAKHGYRQELF